MTHFTGTVNVDVDRVIIKRSSRETLAKLGINRIGFDEESKKYFFRNVYMIK